MGEHGLVLVSSDEELPVQEIVVASDEDMPVATGAPSTLCFWDSGVLWPVAGVEVDMPLPQDVDVHDGSMLMVYWHLFCSAKPINSWPQAQCSDGSSNKMTEKGSAFVAASLIG